MQAQCDICGKTFKNGAGLVGHRRFVHKQGERKFVLKNEVLEGLKGLEARIQHLERQLRRETANLPHTAEITGAVRDFSGGVLRADKDTQSKLEQLSEQFAALDQHARNDLQHDLDGIRKRVDAMAEAKEGRESDWTTVFLACVGIWALARFLGGKPKEEPRGQALPPTTFGGGPSTGPLTVGGLD